MTPLPFLLFGLLAAGLTATIALQLDAEPGSPDFLLALPRPGGGGAALTPPPAEHRDLVAFSLARPLFTPGRRPPAGASPAGGPGGPAELPRLSGTMITPAGRQAIFAGTERPLVVQEGGRIGAYTVQRVAPDRVTLLGVDGLRLLALSFDAGGPRPAAVTTGPAPFQSLAAPGGLDILRNAARQAPPASGGPASAAPPDTLGALPPMPPGAPPTQ